MTDTTAPTHYVPAFKGIYAAFDQIALPLLRVTMGVILMPHGCQKLFGWFGGAGFEKFTGFFDKAGWYPAAFWVAVVALTELVGGFMLAVGFLTRFAAAAIAIFNAQCDLGNVGQGLLLGSGRPRIFLADLCRGARVPDQGRWTLFRRSCLGA